MDEDPKRLFVSEVSSLWEELMEEEFRELGDHKDQPIQGVKVTC